MRTLTHEVGFGRGKSSLISRVVPQYLCFITREVMGPFVYPGGNSVFDCPGSSGFPITRRNWLICFAVRHATLPPLFTPPGASLDAHAKTALEL